MSDREDLGASDLVGRLITNGFGQKETVSLYPEYWNFFDWCVEQGLDMEQWCKYSDIHRRQDSTFSDAIYFDLWRFWCSMFKQGLPCPPNSPPNYYDDFLREVEAGEYKEIFPNDVAAEKNRDEILHVPIVNSKDVTEIISLPRKYWLHYEYLYNRGTDLKLWIKKLDATRIKCQPQSLNLTEYLRAALVKSEEEHFFIDKNMPLYINVSGYD